LRRLKKKGQRITAIYGGARGHGKKVWGYSYTEIAQAAGTTEGAVRIAVHEGRLDPSDLTSVVAWIAKRQEG
jgi:hypothetical protein